MERVQLPPWQLAQRLATHLLGRVSPPRKGPLVLGRRWRCLATTQAALAQQRGRRCQESQGKSRAHASIAGTRQPPGSSEPS